MEPFTTALLWIVIVGFIIAFILAFGIGANDVANSFGTSVGSGVLTIRQACWLATFCEVSGAVLIGYKVSDTMRKGILDVNEYIGSEQDLMLGCLAALASSAIWLLVATFLKLPISGTHSIVGSCIGFSLVARGTRGITWGKLGTIVASWFISPLMSGIVSVVLFWLIRKFILNAKNPFEAGLVALPLIYGAAMFINVFSIVNDGPKLLYMDNIPLWIAVVASVSIGLLVGVLVQTLIVPWQRKKITGVDKNGKPKFTIADSDAESSTNSSPRRQKRPISLVCDGKQLPAITETTELVSLNGGIHSPTSNGLIKKLSRDLSPRALGRTASYKIDPVIVKKAESLLGKVSLDNPDVTITSLNYIDEYEKTIHNERNGVRSIQGYFDRKNSSAKSPEMKDSPVQNGKVQSPKLDDHITDLMLPPNMILDGSAAPAKKELGNCDSGVGLDSMIGSQMLPNNSSKVPLIASKDNLSNAGGSKTKGEETEEVSKLFSFLQIMTASFGSFAHGGNDVSNAIGPLIALYMIYQEGSVTQQSETPLSILLFGGVGISLGLWIWGRRVIQTVGNDLTKITPSTGFTIEIGAALTVLLASKIGLPISTTHCKVGSVVFVGYANGPKNASSTNELEAGFGNPDATPQQKAVDWGLFRNIVYAWVVTVPVAALLSAGIMYALLFVVPTYG